MELLDQTVSVREENATHTRMTYALHGESWTQANNMLRGMPFHYVSQQYFPEDVPDLSRFHALLKHNQEAIQKYANPAYIDIDEPDTIALMPVAAHQECNAIGTALEQYVGQHDLPTSQVLLFLNWPPDADPAAVKKTVDVVQDFQEKHPEVPLAFFGAQLAPSTPIATIRKILWDSALYPLRQSERLDDILLLNHDADITYLSPYHFTEMRYALTNDRHEPAMAIFPYSRHELSNGTLANMDKVIAWYDFCNDYCLQPYETGAGISARAYMAVHGFEPDRRLMELHSLVNSFSPDEDLHGRTSAPLAEIRFSSRRIYSKLAAKLTTADIWDDNFTMNEDYRLSTNFPDITVEHGDELISQHVLKPAHNFFGRLVLSNIIFENLDPDSAIIKASRIVHIARSLFGGNPSDFSDKALVTAYDAYCTHRLTCTCFENNYPPTDSVNCYT